MKQIPIRPFSMHSEIDLKFLSTKSGNKIAYKKSGGKGPTLIWCGGLKSDMEGGKATHLHDWALRESRNFIRFDYFGHGRSTGLFREGTMSQWADDIVQVMDELTQGDIILIGSSMGGWASLLAAQQQASRVKALLLIAPAPDFTEKLTWKNWTKDQRQTLLDDGIVYVPSDYDEPYEYSLALMEDGRANQILDNPIKFEGPVRILQGAQDSVVPWEYSKQIIDVITSADVDYTLVKNGDHSLSSSADLKRLLIVTEELCRLIDT